MDFNFIACDAVEIELAGDAVRGERMRDVQKAIANFCARKAEVTECQHGYAVLRIGDGRLEFENPPTFFHGLRDAVLKVVPGARVKCTVEGGTITFE